MVVAVVVLGEGVLRLLGVLVVEGVGVLGLFSCMAARRLVAASVAEVVVLLVVQPSRRLLLLPLLVPR